MTSTTRTDATLELYLADPEGLALVEAIIARQPDACGECEGTGEPAGDPVDREPIPAVCDTCGGTGAEA